MNLPSVKRMMDVLSIDRDKAKRIRAIMEGPPRTIAGVCGVCEDGLVRELWGVSRDTGLCVCAKHAANARGLHSWEVAKGETRLERIDAVLGTCGVESIPAGHNERSPAIHYCNTGDTYGMTVLKVNGAFKLGSWGDYVERGNYD